MIITMPTELMERHAACTLRLNCVAAFTFSASILVVSRSCRFCLLTTAPIGYELSGVHLMPTLKGIYPYFLALLLIICGSA